MPDVREFLKPESASLKPLHCPEDFPFREAFPILHFPLLWGKKNRPRVMRTGVWLFENLVYHAYDG